MQSWGDREGGSAWAPGAPPPRGRAQRSGAWERRLVLVARGVPGSRVPPPVWTQKRPRPRKEEPGFLNPHVALALQPGRLHGTFRKQGPLGPATEMRGFSCCMSLSCGKNLRKVTSAAAKTAHSRAAGAKREDSPKPGHTEGDRWVAPPEPSLLPGQTPSLHVPAPLPPCSQDLAPELSQAEHSAPPPPTPGCWVPQRPCPREPLSPGKTTTAPEAGVSSEPLTG